MANPISSQITTTLNQTRPVEPAVRRPLNAVNTPDQGAIDTVTNRQDIAASTAAPLQDVSQTETAPKSQLEKAVSDINDYVQTVNRELQFRVDEALPLGRSVVTVVDADTQEVIREFPSEQALELARSLKEQAGTTGQDQIEGLIISARA